MTNEINAFELSDEQLVEVTGGKSTIDITQLAGNLGLQTNAVDASTNAALIGGGKKSNNALGVQGSTNNIGNLFVGINSNKA
jgi:hypothetical protein